MAGVVVCPPPVQDPDDTSQATWSASVVVTEAGDALTLATEQTTKAATVWFGSEGPAIAVNGLDKDKLLEVTPAAVKDATVAGLVFAVTDRDSVDKNIDVKASV
jgi:hypothetical protein